MGLLTGLNTNRRHLHLVGLSSRPHLGGVEQRMKHQPTLSVSVMLWLHPDIYIWAPFPWNQNILRV